MRNTGRKGTQSGQFIGLKQFGLQFRLVLDQFP